MASAKRSNILWCKPPDTIVLELSIEEADALRDVLGRVIGSPYFHTVSPIISPVLKSLDEVYKPKTAEYG